MWLKKINFFIVCGFGIQSGIQYPASYDAGYKYTVPPALAPGRHIYSQGRKSLAGQKINDQTIKTFKI